MFWTQREVNTVNQHNPRGTDGDIEHPDTIVKPAAH